MPGKQKRKVAVTRKRMNDDQWEYNIRSLFISQHIKFKGVKLLKTLEQRLIHNISNGKIDLTKNLE